MIEQARKGDPKAYEALLDAYGHRLFGYFLRACGNVHEAEDLLSEMSLKLVKNLKRYRHDGRFEPWLFRMAANLLRDRIRRRKARPPQASLSAENDDGGRLGETLADSDRPVDADLLADEDRQRLQQALAGLDELTREMILLRHFAELSFKEIADLVDRPIGTVLARVHRGLKKLRGELEVISHDV